MSGSPMVEIPDEPPLQPIQDSQCRLVRALAALGNVYRLLLRGREIHHCLGFPHSANNSCLSGRLHMVVLSGTSERR